MHFSRMKINEVLSAKTTWDKNRIMRYVELFFWWVLPRWLGSRVAFYNVIEWGLINMCHFYLINVNELVARPNPGKDRNYQRE